MFRDCSETWNDGVSKAKKNLHEDNGCHGQDSNWAPERPQA